LNGNRHSFESFIAGPSYNSLPVSFKAALGQRPAGKVQIEAALPIIMPITASACTADPSQCRHARRCCGRSGRLCSRAADRLVQVGHPHVLGNQDVALPVWKVVR